MLLSYSFIAGTHRPLIGDRHEDVLRSRRRLRYGPRPHGRHGPSAAAAVPILLSGGVQQLREQLWLRPQRQRRRRLGRHRRAGHGFPTPGSHGLHGDQPGGHQSRPGHPGNGDDSPVPGSPSPTRSARRSAPQFALRGVQPELLSRPSQPHRLRRRLLSTLPISAHRYGRRAPCIMHWGSFLSL